MGRRRHRCRSGWADDNTTSKSQTDDDDDAADDLTNRVWVKSGENDLPGIIKIFLSDGTLVQNSCWETHRLSAWQMTDAKSVSWNEDGDDIKADIVSLSADELVLSLKLRGGAVEEHYRPPPSPPSARICPSVIAVLLHGQARGPVQPVPAHQRTVACEAAKKPMALPEKARL